MVRVKESRDTISQMNTEELTALAREAVGLVKTAPSTAALLGNSTNTTAANSSLLLLDDPTAVSTEIELFIDLSFCRTIQV